MQTRHKVLPCKFTLFPYPPMGLTENCGTTHKTRMKHCSGLPAKALALRGMLQGRQPDQQQQQPLSFLMEAHSGLSARIVEEAGFKGIWASGLSISASLGLRDNNEASWTQMTDVFEYMSQATTVPILVDADTGYGNFNNARMLVRKLEKIGIAGACIEDKLFPKTNSLLDERSAQPLADVKEFAGKIRAMKDYQTDPNFCVVARIESFIAGWPLEEALTRANAYADAGADAILVHSKKNDPSDIEAFMKHWVHRDGSQKAPIVIVPTNYPATPVARFQELKVSTVIWANHNVRASIKAMQQTTKMIFDQQSLVAANSSIASVKEIFRLQNQDEYLTAEDRYLPKN